MSTKKKDAAGSNGPAVTVKYDAEALANMCLKVKAEGFVPGADLKAEFGGEQYTRGIAVLYRDFRMFREVVRPWKDDTNVIGYEWADRRFSKAETKQIPPALEFLLELTTKLAPKYSDFQSVTAKCRFVSAVLGGCPVPDADGKPLNAFERDGNGRLQILRYNQRAMIAQALPMIAKEQALARRIAFKTVTIDAAKQVTTVERPVNDHGQGKGMCRSERLPAGTEFTIEAMIPTSIISIAEYLQALKLAGEVVGLSPGRSAGFGDFEILEAA